MSVGDWYATTVTVIFDEAGVDLDDARAEEIADGLIAMPQVSTVRVGTGASETVYRADIFAGDQDAAKVRATELVVGIVKRMAIGVPRVLAVDATTDFDALPEGFRLLLERRRASRDDTTT